MCDETPGSKAAELMQLGFGVSVDAAEYENEMDEILEIARMLNSNLILRNLPDSMLNPKSLKKLKNHVWTL